MPNKSNRILYQLKVTLLDIQPPIWRRIQVWDDTTLAQLHRILHISVGWENYHLHEFHVGRRVYGEPDPDGLDERPVIDDRRQRLRELVPQVGTSFEYVYDFGDNWRHEHTNCCWRLSYFPSRSNSIPAALRESAADHPRM
jgi:hypothetical protein